MIKIYVFDKIDNVSHFYTFEQLFHCTCTDSVIITSDAAYLQSTNGSCPHRRRKLLGRAGHF